MKQRIAVAIKIIGGLLLHSGPARHIEDFTPVLYTEKRTVRVIGEPRRRSMTYGVIRGEKLQLSLGHSLHRLHHCWRQWIMQLNFSFS
jgi:hypothetical protein